MIDRPTESFANTGQMLNKHADTAKQEKWMYRVQQRLTGFAVRMWQLKVRLLIIAVALTGATYYVSNAILGTAVQIDTAVRADFVQTVVASGRVAAPFRVDVGAQITGVVVEIPVDEGQAVNAGDVLIELDDREALAEVVQAEGVVAQSEARLRQLRELTLPSAEQSLRQAKATLDNAQKYYDREAKLLTAIAKSELDEATKNLDIAKTQVRSAELQVFTSRVGGSDYVLLQTQLNQARAALSTAQLRLSYTKVRAPRTGLLISREVEKGNVVQAGKVLMKLSPAVEPQLIVQIDEKNLALIAVGQSALASADAYPKLTFPAEVAYVNPGIDLQRASVEVKLRVPSPPDYLRQDMTVSVDIEVARRPKALIVPAGSIREPASEHPWVMKILSGKAQKQPVQVGIVSGGKAEILSGLEAGDRLIPANLSTIKTGQRVRAQPSKSFLP